MNQTIPRPSWLYRTGARVHDLIGYPRFQRAYVGEQTPACAEASPVGVEEELNGRMLRYPRNHYYRIVNRRIVPSFKLYERLHVITKAYPEPLQSFLDIGCCRGFYVLDAAVRRHCPRAVGIDVHEPFVATAREARQYLHVTNAAFHHASLEEVSSNPQKFGGPFQVVLLVGTYHYLFWGSLLCPTAYLSHEEILRRLASICSDRVLISARFTVDRLPYALKAKLKDDPAPQTCKSYTLEAFLRDAEKLFSIRHAGYLGVDPLLVMTKNA